jgi:hypothetical protein
MKYKVIVEFADLEDGNHVYHVGDTYPRHGLAPAKERVGFLQSSQNLLHTPVIEAVEVTDFDNAMNEPVEQGTVESAEEKPKTAKEKPKRRTRKTTKKAEQD